MADQIPAGWYPVEGDPTIERWFDGVNWGQTRPIGGAATTAEFAQPTQQIPATQQIPVQQPQQFAQPAQQQPQFAQPAQQQPYAAGLPPQPTNSGGGNKIWIALAGGLAALVVLGGGAFALFGGGDDGGDIDATGTTVPTATIADAPTTTVAPATTTTAAPTTTTTTAPTTTTVALINCSIAGTYSFDTTFPTCESAFTRGRELGVEANVLAIPDASIGDLYVGGLCQAVQGTEQRGATEFGAAMAGLLAAEVCPGDATRVIDGLGAELGLEIISNAGVMEETEGVDIGDAAIVDLIRDILGDRIPALLIVDDSLLIDIGNDLCAVAITSDDSDEFTETLVLVWDGLDADSRDVFMDDIALYGEFAGAELAGFCPDEFDRLFN